MFRSSISLAASPARMFGEAVISGFDITSTTLVFSGSRDLQTILFDRSLSVRIPTGFSQLTTMRQPISWMFISSAAFFTVALGSIVTTFSVMIFRSFCDTIIPKPFQYFF